MAHADSGRWPRLALTLASLLVAIVVAVLGTPVLAQTAMSPFTLLVPQDGTLVEEPHIHLVASSRLIPLQRLVVTLNGAPLDKGACPASKRQQEFLHCQLVLAPGLNRLEVRDSAADPAGPPLAAAGIYYHSTLGQLSAIPAGFEKQPLHRGEQTRACLPCHGAALTLAPPVPEVPANALCLDCHRSIQGYRRLHGPVANSMCYMCHDPQSRPARFAVQQPVIDVCFRCHSARMKVIWEKGPYRHGPPATGRCVICHNPHGSENEYWLKKPTWDLCTNCHTEKATDRHVLTGFVYGDSHPTRGRPHPLKPGEELNCAACHNPHASPARYLWNFGVSERFRLCQKCHRK